VNGATTGNSPHGARELGTVALIALAALAALAVTAWEYVLAIILNPEVDWSPVGLTTHGAIDLALLLPAALVAVLVGRWLARRLGFTTETADGALGAVAVAALLFAAVALPIDAGRDLVHEWVGTTWNVSLAEVRTTVVGSDLTVQESTQLCSFSAVQNPSLARTDATGQLLADRMLAAGRALTMQLAVLVPLLLLVGGGPIRRQLGAWRAPLAALGHTRLARFSALGVAGIALFCAGDWSDTAARPAMAQPVAAPYNACTQGGPVRSYDVSAIDITITLNRYGDHVNGAFMYALDANIPTIRAFEAGLDADRSAAEGADVTRVSHGLRKDPIQPLVLRANLGECLRVSFTNRLGDDQPASMHILGLPHTVSNAGSEVGENPSSMTAPGETVTYEIPIPRDPSAERAYYFHDHGAGRRRQNMGLFGAIVAEPEGATYLDVESGEPLDTITGSNWEAIIVNPNVAEAEDGKSFREFVVFYHEIGDEAFTDIRDRDNKKLPLVDDIAGVYRPAARALNYRSEPFRRRLEIEKTAKSLGYSSYPFGDPATPIPRSYVGEATKTRLLHGGSEVFHVHHLHGGGDRWRRNPNADPNNDFWKGLTKVPDPNLTSVHLDSQSIGPGTSYNLEHECGAGGCQQGVGDFLYHCHIGHHYISGMWSFWRVFGTIQTADTNINGWPLAVIPELFQNPDNPLIVPTPPAPGVSAGGLIGLRVDDGRTIVAEGQVSDPATEIGIRQWIAGQLPPRGTRLDKHDATVWDWTLAGGGASLRVLGEPEATQPFEGYVSRIPGHRPEVLFNPKNGRYTWPLFRPQKGQRPPFSARHSGAPWLGEEMKEGRLDGLCARNGVDPSVDVGNAVKRFYPVSSITLPVQVSRDRVDPDGMLFVLNEEEQAIRSGDKPAEPLTIRSNVGDCVEIVFTNKIPDGPLNKEFSKTNIHSHFVQFDTQASDGVITGFSYEQSVRPYETEGRELTAPVSPGATTLSVNQVDALREGVWIGVGLGEGTCGTAASGQPLPCTEVRKIVSLPDANTIVLDQPLDGFHDTGDAVGVEFVRYNWYSDVDVGTVFFHQHVEFKDWDHGLFGAHVVEPKGSTYHDPVTGEEVRSGTLVDVRVDPAAGGNPVADGVEGSFREFMLYLHDNNPAEGQFVRGGGTINLRAEPWRLREDGDPAHLFSSVTHGDPMTPLVRAYLGDPVVVRGMGLVERVGGIRFTGHRFNVERTSRKSDMRDGQFIGISERFDVSLDGGAGGPGGYPGDYLYYSTLGRDFESGAWGILRVHDRTEPDLQPLPGHQPLAGDGFPSLAFTGGAPPPAPSGPSTACPADAPRREYSIVAADAGIIYNDQMLPDVTGTVYRPKGQPSTSARTPMVLRANKGECLVINLRNARNRRSSISVGELLFDPQRSYGSAIGYNFDSTVPPGGGRSYELYADRELGMVLGLNLADIESVEKGAFAGIVIEPEGAVYRRPGRAEALPEGGMGVQADIEVDGQPIRELVALFSDQDRRIGQNTMPYPADVENFNGISYASEPLRLRDRRGRPADVFSSDLWGDPRLVNRVPAGTPLVYRVAQPWGNQAHVPTLEGHRWYLDPGMPGTEQVFADVLVPGMSLDLWFVNGAGGDISAPGDYLFLDRRQPFLEGGLWNILRVTDGASGGTDSVTINFAQVLPGAGPDRLDVGGRVGIRPAGDTVRQVTLTNGSLGPDGCGGPVLGTAPVDPGSGTFRFRRAVGPMPSEVCVSSPAGGIAHRSVQ